MKNRCMWVLLTMVVFSLSGWSFSVYADVCPDPDDPRVEYITGSHNDPEICATVRFQCREESGYSEQLFSNECGCGCTQNEAIWVRKKVTEGDAVVIELESDIRAGQVWEVASTNRTLGYPEKQYIPSHDATTGTWKLLTRFTWDTSSQGSLSKVGIHEVVLHLKRLWGGRNDTLYNIAYATIRVEKQAEVAICGDPSIVALFDACRTADNQTSCEANGGNWARAGMIGLEQCLCPTGQDGCSCSDGSDCLSGFCVGLVDLDFCSGPMDGVCSTVAPLFGCNCSIENGEAFGLCID